MSDLFSYPPPPSILSPASELTQGGRAGEGEVPVDPGGRGAREVPGGAKGYLVERRRAQLVLERLPQRADRKFLLVPAAEQHWLLHQNPSRQETAESVARRYSVTGQPLRRSLKQPSVPLSGILYVQWPHTARLRAASDATVKGHSGV